MTYDERDPREVPPDEGDDRAVDPDAPRMADPEAAPDDDAAGMARDETTPDETTPDEPPQDATPQETMPAAADEFETASWPTQDREPEPAPDVQPGDSYASYTTEEPPAGQYATEQPPAGEPFEASDLPAREPGPPPPDVEAYAPTPDGTEPVLPAHSVPATEPGESTLCARCGTENRPGIAFCRNCGQRLVAAGAPATVERPSVPEGTQACPRCGTHNRAGVAFCQNCGANLRVAATGYVPPAVAAGERAAADRDEAATGRAVLGPIVLLIGAVGIAVAWLLPFPFGEGSLYDRAFGGSDGYGIAFWNAYDGISGLASQAYFGFAAPAPVLVALLVLLAVGGFLRAAPAVLQLLGLTVALVWAIGLGALFVVVEVLGGSGGEIIDILRGLTPGGIIFLLSSLIVVIGVLTRFGRG
jgi:hypothetical protein